MSSVATVVVVDNDPDLGALIRTLLAGHGVSVVATSDGREALAYLVEHDLPAVILLDFNMPNMDGFEFRAVQLKDERLRSVPVVFMTAINEIPQQSGELHQIRCLKKPFEVQDLIDAVAPYVTASKGDSRTTSG
jgi:CheY-like chemotaxis protein